MKKSAAEAHRMLSNMVRPLLVKEREWFQRFKNDDFDVEDRHSSGREKVFEDAELEALARRVKIKKNWHDHWE